MFFKGTVTICWREIIPVVKLAQSEPGGVVRVDAFVCFDMHVQMTCTVLQLGACKLHFRCVAICSCMYYISVCVCISLCSFVPETPFTSFHCF